MKKIKQQSPLKAARKGSREVEIEMYGRPIPQHKVHESKKAYNRTRAKADLKKGQPFLWELVRLVPKNVLNIKKSFR